MAVAQAGQMQKILMRLLIAPLIAVVINLLAILHVAFDKRRNELILTVKMRFWNLFWAIIGLGIVGMFFLYLIVENVSAK